MELPIRGKTARRFRKCPIEAKQNNSGQMKSLQKFSTRVFDLYTKCRSLPASHCKCLIISILYGSKLAPGVHRDTCPKVQGHAEACQLGELNEAQSIQMDTRDFVRRPASCLAPFEPRPDPERLRPLPVCDRHGPRQIRSL